jgi:hypothetical protein
MKLLRFASAGFMIVIAAVILFCMRPEPASKIIRCGSNCPALTDTFSIQLLCPNGCEHYKVGDSVEIKWCFPPRYPFSQTRVRISTDNGKTYREISEYLVDYPFRYPIDSYIWVVSDSDITASCKIKVQDYDGNVFDASDTTFTITAQ